MKTLFTLTLALLLSSQALLAAKGGGSLDGGGADVVLLPHTGDDSARLADPWLKAETPVNKELCPEHVSMPSQLQNELKRINGLLRRYGNDDKANFVEKRVLNPEIHYCFVDQLPTRKSCQNRMEYAKLPSGAEVQQVACTEGRYTWIVKNLVSKMSVREQALLYVHEGLRRTKTEASLIAQVTDGLAILLRELNNQFAGVYNTLNNDEKFTILEMNKAIVLAGMTSKDPSTLDNDTIEELNDTWTLTNGGGLIDKNALPISPSVYIGVGSILKHGSSIGENSVLIASSLWGAVGSKAKIISSDISLGMRVGLAGDNLFINNSKVTLLLGLYSTQKHYPLIANNVKILNSTVEWHAPNLNYTEEAIINANTVIQDSSITARNVDFKIGANVKVLNSRVNNVFSLADRFTLENSILSNENINGVNKILTSEDTKILNSQITNFAGTLTIGKQVILENIREAKLQPSSISESIAIPDGVKIEGGSLPVCAGNGVIAHHRLIGTTQIYSLAELQALCQAK